MSQHKKKLSLELTVSLTKACFLEILHLILEFVFLCEILFRILLLFIHYFICVESEYITWYSVLLPGKPAIKKI